MKLPRKQVTIPILSGIILIVLSHLHSLDVEWWPLTQEVTEDVGVAGILFGLFSALLELEEIKKYFAERLEDIVIKQEYLHTLDVELIWTNVAVAKFKNPQLNESDSFLRFLFENLTDYLKLPYREEVAAYVIATGAENDGLRIFDTVTYTCRAVNGNIDELVGWAAGGAAFRTVEFIRISVTYPTGHPDAGRTDEVGKTRPGERSLTFNLRKKHNIDRLEVRIEACYEIDPRNLQHWIQKEPCKGLAFRADFPDKYDIQFSSFVPSEKLEDVEATPSSFKYSYSGWTMPFNGCAWMLRKKSDAQQDSHEL